MCGLTRVFFAVDFKIDFTNDYSAGGVNSRDTSSVPALSR